MKGTWEEDCRRCGLTVWRASLDADTAVKAGYRSTTILLLPHVSTRGNITINRDGLAVFTGRHPGDLERHRCPASVTRCKYCHQPIRVLAQPPGADEILAVVDADPDPRGVVAVDQAGYAIRDPGHALPGDRYRWHTKHEREAAR